MKSLPTHAVDAVSGDFQLWRASSQEFRHAGGTDLAGNFQQTAPISQWSKPYWDTEMSRISKNVVITAMLLGLSAGAFAQGAGGGGGAGSGGAGGGGGAAGGGGTGMGTPNGGGDTNAVSTSKGPNTMGSGSGTSKKKMSKKSMNKGAMDTPASGG